MPSALTTARAAARHSRQEAANAKAKGVRRSVRTGKRNREQSSFVGCNQGLDTWQYGRDPLRLCGRVAPTSERSCSTAPPKRTQRPHHSFGANLELHWHVVCRSALRHHCTHSVAPNSFTCTCSGPGQFTPLASSSFVSTCAEKPDLPPHCAKGSAHPASSLIALLSRAAPSARQHTIARTALDPELLHTTGCSPPQPRRPALLVVRPSLSLNSLVGSYISCHSRVPFGPVLFAEAGFPGSLSRSSSPTASTSTSPTSESASRPHLPCLGRICKAAPLLNNTAILSIIDVIATVNLAASPAKLPTLHCIPSPRTQKPDSGLLSSCASTLHPSRTLSFAATPTPILRFHHGSDSGLGFGYKTVPPHTSSTGLSSTHNLVHSPALRRSPF
ncbi:hypothetical protein L1887_56445 [Cichorium endivia]|nr:hypothetical protein L1887_56445 [Cichorium endivia]